MPPSSSPSTPPALQAAWQPGCKLLLLNLPCNPTGGVCSREQLERIAKFAIEKDLIVISDEIYSELVFEGVHTSIASLPGMRERTILLHGFSKAFAMTGFRLGYACGPARADRGHDEGAPVFDAVRPEHQPGRRRGGAAPRRRCHQIHARPLPRASRPFCPPHQRGRP
jgi:aspartate/methionine/tyrosine aminotransferase